MSPEALSPCPLCGRFGLYKRESRQTGNVYVLDCANCRRLVIPGLFFTMLWDMEEGLRRALGKLLAENEQQYGPSLLLDADRCRSLLADLRAPGGNVDPKPAGEE